MTLSNILLASKMNYHPTSYAVSEVMSNPSSMSSMSKTGGIRFRFPDSCLCRNGEPSRAR